RYQGMGFGTTPAVSTINYSLLNTSYIEYQATVNTSTMAGLVFDYRGPTDFKFATIDANSNQLVIGHRTTVSFVADAVMSRSIPKGSDQLVGISLQNKTVKMFVGGVAGPTFTFLTTLFTGQLG